MSKIKIVSFFTGLGGLDLGFEQAGCKTIWANDFEENAVESFNLNHNSQIAIHGDLRLLNFDEIPQGDIFIGGPPCQSYSLVGRRDPDDSRGELVFHYLNLIKEKRPRAFLMENVPGLAASKLNGMSMPEYLKGEFEKCGYKVEIAKLSANDFGVPQKRKRIFVYGSLKKKPLVPDSTLFLKKVLKVDPSKYSISALAAIGDLGKCTKSAERAKYSSKPHSLFAKLMREESLKDVSLHEMPRMSAKDQAFVKHIPPGGNYTNIPDDISTLRIMKFKASGGRTTTYGRLHPDHPSYTINTYFRRPNVGANFHYSEERLITPREAMRFQSFPDHIEIVYSAQDERNSFIGNAVPPLLARAVAEELLKTF